MLRDRLTNKYIGTVSHGTLRNIDLLEKYSSFAREIKNQVNLKPFYKERLTGLIVESRDLLNDLSEEEINADEEVSYMINEDWFYLFNEIAPKNCHFGSNEGDGADFGFWPNWDQLSQEEIEKMIE